MALIIRWTSEDGKRKWLYPVEKDIYTKGKIVKQVSTKAKVIGITRVNIPSPMHPIIPYNILLLEDEHGNRLPKKVMSKYDIGDAYELKQAQSDSAVIITKVKYDIEEYLKETLKLLHNCSFTAEDKVLIVPNLSEPAYGYQAVTTNPKVVDGLISYLKEADVTDIVVGAQAALGNDVQSAAKKSGMLSVCKKQEVEFVDLSSGEFVEKEIDGETYSIAKLATERRIVNVPVFKTHSQLTISGALENLVRLCEKKTQLSLYDKNIDQALSKLSSVFSDALHICDGTIGLQGNGPTLLGEPAFLNLLFASKDAVAMDTVLVEMGMFSKPVFLKEANGETNPKKIEIVGDELEAIKFHIKKANNETAHPNIFLIDGNANPADFNTALKTAAKLFGLLGHKLHIVIGKHLTKEDFEGKSRFVALGSDGIEKMKELGITPIAEIGSDIGTVEKIMLVKSVLEDSEKESISVLDKAKSKMASFGMKIKKTISK